ncbi:hypothetical protein Rctr197k_036 [Virus Rctr197k]|nr:hypothetical protein Rctr197k_036 [Virus Rctr197k]
MKLRDTFLHRAPAPAPHPLGVMKEALSGIGDRDIRTAQDFLWSMGVSPVAGAHGIQQWMPAEGDAVEFDVPNGDGVRRAGLVHQVQGRDAIVKVNDGEFNIVPLDRLMPRSSGRRRAERRAEIQAALGQRGPRLCETRALIPVGTGTDYAMTLEYTAGMRPTSEDVDAYISSRYPGARIVDGDDTYPGRLGLVIAFQHPEQGRRALAASRQVAQLETPAEPPSSRENATGIGTEEIEGTGKIGADADTDGGTMGQGGDDLQPLGGGEAVISTEKKHAWLDASAKALEKLAAQYPFADITETSIEETSLGFISHFAMTENGRRLFVREGSLTPVLAEGCAPAIGTVAVSEAGVAVHLTHVLVADYDLPVVAAWSKVGDYDAGQGPLSMHEDEPGANESGSYVVKAVSPPGKEHVVRELKKEPGVDNPYVDASFEQDGKAPWQQMDYRREKERYDLEQAERTKAEEKAKQRRLQRQQQSVSAPPAPTSVMGAQSPATEDDGEVRETIGGPGLHIAVDDTAEDYYDDYFGEYGKQLTKDIATHVGGLVRSAWKQAGRGEPTAEELLWATGILMAPLDWDASRRVADQYDDLAQKLMQSANVSGQARQQLMQMVSQELASAGPVIQKRFRAGDPAVMQKMLPQLLRSMDPKKLDQLTYAIAPDEPTAKQPGWLSRNVFQRGREKTRNQIQKGLELQQLLGGPAAPAGAGGGAGAGAPAGAGAGAGADAGRGVVTAPSAVTLTGPDGKPMQVPAGSRMILLPGGATQKAPSAQPTPPTPQTPAAPATQTPAAPQPSPTAAPPPPATAGEAAGRQQRAYVEIPQGAEAYDLDGRRIRVGQPMSAMVLKDEGGIQIVRTDQGQVLRLGGPRAQASRRIADSASEAYAGRRPPALNQLRFRMEGLSRRGDYLVAAIVWDVEATEAMAPANVVANLKAYVKQRAGEKEFIDLGFIGRPVLENVDLAMGLAEVRFRSSESRNGPQEVVEREDATYHELV